MMKLFISYIIEGTISFSVLFLAYQLFLSQYKNLQFNRIYLLFTGIFSLTIPLIHIPLNLNSPTTGGFERITQLPTIIINSTSGKLNESHIANIQLLDIILLIYFSGLLFIFIRIIIHSVRILSFIYTHKKNAVKKDEYYLIPTQGKFATCSFFNYLLWDNTIYLNEKENKFILEHELVHIHQRHSLDVLFSELVSLFFWFNPLIYFFKNSLKAIHEFIADDAVVTQAEKELYISILSSHTLKKMQLIFGNNFYQTQIFKRMNMIKTEKKRSWLSRISLTLPILALLIYTFACETKDAGENQMVLPDGFAWIESEQAPENVQSELKKLNNSDLGVLFYQGEFDGDAKEFVESINPQIIEVKKENELTQVYVIAHKNLELAKADGTHKLTTNVLDENPVPEGGFEVLFKHIMQDLKYPKEAIENGVEGKVMLEFVVSETGELDSVRVVQGIGYGCDEEAIRVLKDFKSWNPGLLDGKPVKAKMILPIKFKLDPNEKTENKIEMEMKSSDDNTKTEKKEVVVVE